MILNSVILAIACLGATQTGANSYRLDYEVGRGLCSQVYTTSSTGYYFNTYFDLQNFKVFYENNEIDSATIDNVNLYIECYDINDTLIDSRSLSFNRNLFNNQDFYTSNTYLLTEVEGTHINYSLYYNGTYLDEVYYDTGLSLVGSDFRCDFSFLESNLIDYYSFYYGGNSYQSGYFKGYDIGVQEGISQGYANGYSDGYAEASTTDSTALTIFSGITSVALLPVDMFLKMLNFNVLGINLTGLVTGFITLGITLYIIRMILGGKTND